MDELTDDEFGHLVAEDGLSRHFEGQEVDDQEWRENMLRRTADLRIEAADAFRIVIGATFAITAAQYWAAGGFRELGIRGIEDTEFGYRVHANGAVMVLDRDAVHWHQGRRTMNLRPHAADPSRAPAVRRATVAGAWLSQAGTRPARPAGTHRAAYGRPRVGDAERLNDLRGRVDPDHLVVGADEVAQAPDGMPFVASFCDIWLPAEAASPTARFDSSPASSNAAASA